MTTVNELSNIILMLIRAGVVFRLAFIFIQMAVNEDEVQPGKRRIKNTLKFYIAAELVFALKALIVGYY